LSKAGGIVIETIVPSAEMDAARTALAGIRDGVGIAVSRAVNKVAASARKDVVDMIAAAGPLKKSEIRRRNVSLLNATRIKLYAHLRISGYKLPIALLGATQDDQGVSYTAGGKTAFVPRGFLARSPKGVRQAYKRIPDYGGEDRGGHHRLVDRLPVRVLKGPSVVETLEGLPAFSVRAFQQRMYSQLGAEIRRQVEVLLAQREPARSA
jgi:hypothetical protein